MSNGTNTGPAPLAQLDDHQKKMLFWACWAALVATSFGFVVRSFLIGQWGQDFNLSETEKGAILGVGLWPFAISIILFSLVVDRIGYGRAMFFAFACHVLSVILTVTAKGYTQLYWGTFIVALANGTVEAVANPVVATMFADQKTKWLNLLHAGWPGGLVLGGILALFMGNADWKLKVGLILIPTAVYGVLMLGKKWPVHERVAAGVPYKAMLREFGIVGAFLACLLMFAALSQAFNFSWIVVVVASVIAAGIFGAFSGFSPGRGLFILLLIVMIPLATTELGVDTWVTDLMTPQMAAIGLQGGWVLVYTSLIMMILRMNAGSIVHRMSPLALLATASLIAMIGLLFLSKAAGVSILIAATVYGVGKSFFWPTMLATVSEQFPKGGALTLNATGGLGMLGVGVVGAVLLGYIQDTSVAKHLDTAKPAIYQQVSVEKSWPLGTYMTVDKAKVDALAGTDKEEVTTIIDDAKKQALMTVAIFPAIMLVSYLLMMLYFKSKGGYRPVPIEEAAASEAAPVTV